MAARNLLANLVNQASAQGGGIQPGAHPEFEPRPQIRPRIRPHPGFPNVGHLFNQGPVPGEPGTPEWNEMEKEIQWKKSINRGYQKYLTTTK
jgi:hypothetical protein